MWELDAINFVKLIIKLRNDPEQPRIQQNWSIQYFLLERQLSISIINNIKT